MPSISGRCDIRSFIDERFELTEIVEEIAQLGYERVKAQWERTRTYKKNDDN